MGPKYLRFLEAVEEWGQSVRRGGRGLELMDMSHLIRRMEEALGQPVL
jgi:hypothetical protein